jgi:LicD family
MVLMLRLSMVYVSIFLTAIASFVHSYKYFMEAEGRGLSHYDKRYFKRRVPQEKRAETLSELIVAYNDIMEAEGIVTWLAHGTLLGWYWNGHVLPWYLIILYYNSADLRDWDLDMQVDVTSLQTLAEEYNYTTWSVIPSNAAPGAKPRDYFLDVNPLWLERVHGDGKNFIDARFIDTRNGLYIDITALTELDPSNIPGMVSCKNFHNYFLEDIYPLRESLFEGAKAKIPYNYKSVLQDEYGQKALVLANFNG